MTCAYCLYCRAEEYDDHNGAARIDYYCTIPDGMKDEPLASLTPCPLFVMFITEETT